MKKKTADRLILFAVSFLFTLFLYSCGSEKIDPNDDGPTYGTIRIAVDETLRPVIDSQVSTFQSIYTRAVVNTVYKNEVESMTDLLNDSVRLVIIGRDFLPDEMKVFENLQLVPKRTKIAFDAIALVVHPKNNDTLLRSQFVLDLLEGKINKWNQLSPGSKNNNNVQVVFDNKNSGIVRYFLNLLPSHKLNAKQVFAVDSTAGVVEYVKKNPDALGFINLAWVADSKDSTITRFLSSVRVAEVAPPDTSQDAGKYYKPYLANLALKKYTFSRSIYILSREARAGLGTGFASFVAGDKGQRIIYKAGLLPATMPIRLVELDNEKINIK